MKKNYANIALNLPIDSLFTYRIPDYLKESAEAGKRVLVNFGNRAITGIIVELNEDTILKKVKEIKTVLDEQRIITDELIQFCSWISEYYLSPVGEVLFSAIPRKFNIKSEIYYSLTENHRDRLDNEKFTEEIFIDIIKILEKNRHAGFTKKQLQKKLKYNDLSKYLSRLNETDIISGEGYYSKPTNPKFVKVVSKNFNSGDISLLIKELKLRSPKQIQLLNRVLLQDNSELLLSVKN